ncbi:MAG: nitrate reductase cytochrome c550-type subunit [Osedax symbiont Rs1]|nr:MAG: nitrate reductase cytochrome c550-type subunit [Osedax symbiont Rs1]
MKKLLLATLLLVSSVVFAANEGVMSLRSQSLDVQDPAEKLKNYPKENLQQPINYIQQPPLIPHHIRGYEVDRKTNKCLTCHSFKNFKRYGATKISVTHFINREGQALSDVSPRRYFCLQCHVPQVKAKPLVENTFEPTGALAE